MISALMIGVVMYASVRQRSEGLLASWDFPKVFPDVILVSGRGAPLEEIMKLKNVDGVTAVTGIGVASVPIEKRIFGSGRVVNSGNTRFAAVDVPTFRNMVEMEFLQGDPKTAMDRLQKGDAILVSQEFHNARGINLGDTLPLKTHDGTVNFEVAGVVKSSGIEMMQNFFDVGGNFREEAVSSVVGTLDDGKKYFGIGGVNVALVNMNLNGRTASKAMEEIRDKANGQGALKSSFSGWGLPPASEPATQNAAATAPATAPDEESSWGIIAATFGQAFNWQATSVVEMKQFVGDFVHRMVSALSTIAIAAMCVASLGVANMVIASMQARSYEFGILRAVGIGRGQLLRMVLAEVTLVSLVAGALGSLAGLHFTFMGTSVDRLLIGYTTPFANLDMLPRMIMHVIVGISVTVLLGWLAALVPAMRTAFRPQRELLAEGRA
jgi:putative ABC transport system permease protein